MKLQIVELELDSLEDRIEWIMEDCKRIGNEQLKELLTNE
jgi:hypothetical protein